MKSQVSVEYLILFGFVLAAILIPVFSLLRLTTTETVAGSVNLKKANDLGYGIVNTAEDQYYLGLYSRTTIVLDIPEGMKKAFLLKLEKGGKKSYYFVIDLDTRYYYQSKAPLAAEESYSDYTAVYDVAECDEDYSCGVADITDLFEHRSNIGLRIETLLENNEEKVFVSAAE